MDKIRLIVAQGPLQLITAITALRHKDTVKQSETYQDILVLGYYCGVELDEVCLQIARSWNFASILSFRQFEYLYTTGQADFPALTKILRDNLNIPQVDSVYVCRNWQLINEAFLNAYPEANKYCYGDGIGFIDIKRNGDETPSQALSPSGYVEIDHSFLIVAHHWTKPIDSFPHTLIDPGFLRITVLEAVKQIDYLKEYCDQIISIAGSKLSIALTSNHTESGCFRGHLEEVECYYNCLNRHGDKDSTLLIKSHPREMHQQSQILGQILSEQGWKVLLISEPFSKVPIELFLAHLHPQIVHSFFSGSCMSIAYLYGTTLNIGIGEDLLKQYYTGDTLAKALYEEQIFSIFASQGANKTFHKIDSLEVLAEVRNNNIRHQHPIHHAQLDLVSVAHSNEITY